MCEYCEWQRDAEEMVTLQEGGLTMYVCNGDQLVVENDDENVMSHATINYCPMCGESL